MYIDHQRSWFLHNNVHSNRADGGIDVGSTVGILLDLERRQLTFYVNDESQVCRSVTLIVKLVSVSTKIVVLLFSFRGRLLSTICAESFIRPFRLTAT
jgi:hypothetical protein